MLRAITVLDVSDLMNFNVVKAVSFPDTPSGDDKARELFESWVKEQEPNVTDVQLSVYFEEGKFELGLSLIAVVRST